MSASGDLPFPCRPPCLPRRLISERSFHKIPKSGNLKKQTPPPPPTPYTLKLFLLADPHSGGGRGGVVLAVVRRLSRVGAALPAPLPGVETGGDPAAPARRSLPRLALPVRPRLPGVRSPRRVTGKPRRRLCAPRRLKK